MRQSIIVGIIAVLGILLGAYLLGLQFSGPRPQPGGALQTVRFIGEVDDYTFEFTSLVPKGTPVQRPEDPTHPNNVFNNWYRAYFSNGVMELGESAWNFNNPINLDITLYSAWKPMTYTVTFTNDNDSVLFTDEVFKNDPYLSFPEPPKRAGYTLVGWRDVKTKNIWNFDDEVTEPMKLQAVWVLDLAMFAADESTSYLLDGDGNIWYWGQWDKRYQTRPARLAVEERVFVEDEYLRDEDGKIIKDENDDPVPNPDYYTYVTLTKRIDFIASGGTERVKVGDIKNEDDVIIGEIFGGGTSLVAIDKDGYLWIAGSNDNGKLGTGTASTTFYSKPERLNILNPANSQRMKFKYAAVGENHVMLIDIDGNLWAIGLNSEGQLGDGSKTNRTVPTKLNHAGVKYAEIFIAPKHTLALDTDGKLWGWGLGYGISPVQIMSEVKSVAAGANGNMAITTDGKLYVWGTHTGSNDYAHPAEIVLQDKTFISVVAGSNYYLALASDNKMYGWCIDSNKVVLPNGTEPQMLRSEDLCQLFKDKSFTQIQGGTNHALALDINGDLWIWGVNANAQLGNGTRDEIDATDAPIVVKLS